tara:strand:- start:837 stop:1151 length:315 start_codon:yes stop_codon:yes gene_type:complete
MKENETPTPVNVSSNSVTPFEKAEANAMSFVGSFLFLEKFNEMVEQYQALELVLEELEDESEMSDSMKELYATSSKVLLAEKARMEESFVQAAVAWRTKFGYDA